MFKEIFKKNKKTGPPEPEFFDSPEGVKEKAESVKNYFMKRPVFLVLLLFIGTFFLFSIFKPISKKVNKEQMVSSVEEGRVVMTAAAMEKAIEKSARSSKIAKENVREIRREQKKRKYDSEIAVYIIKPNKENDFYREEQAKDLRLGLPSGTKIPALLLDRVLSFNVQAPVQAITSKDFRVGDKIVIPKNSRFLGEADVVKSLDRINVRFDLLIFPDGREIKVRALALSEDGAAGIQGKVDKHTDTKVLKAIGESVLSVGSLFLGGRDPDPFSLQDQLRLNLSESLHDEARQNLKESKVEKSITVESYAPIQVILLESV